MTNKNNEIKQEKKHLDTRYTRDDPELISKIEFLKAFLKKSRTTQLIDFLIDDKFQQIQLSKTDNKRTTKTNTKKKTNKGDKNSRKN